MNKLPIHVAIIMDGNGRWAQQRHLPRLLGHRAGSKNTLHIIRACSKRGIKILTLFAFSTQNWERPQWEVSGLLHLFSQSFDNDLKEILTLDICVRIVGELQRLPGTLQAKIKEVERLTEHKTGLLLVIAVSYGGQWDIVEAAKRLATEVSQGHLNIQEITPQHFSAQLQLGHLSSPDLCIRTGGEYRISNFLLWHLAYSELYFTQTLWPDFNEKDLDQAIQVYSHRDRRFGALHEKNT